MYNFWKLSRGYCRSARRDDKENLMALMNSEEMSETSDNGGVLESEINEICGGKYPWFVYISEEEIFSGAAALLRQGEGTAEICVMLSRDVRRQGIGSEIVRRFCGVASLVMDIQYVYARVLADNLPSMRFFESLGFVKTAKLPPRLAVPNEKPSVYYMKRTLSGDVSLPSVSIVVPVHNGMKHLDRLFASLKNVRAQIVAVDDMSDDGSARYLKRMSESDKRLKVICSENRLFASGARNTGIKYAENDYVWFLDCDDELTDAHTFERMRRTAFASGADLVYTTKYIRKNGDNCEEITMADEISGVINSQMRRLMFARQFPIWTGWYKRDKLSEYSLFFPEDIRCYEDNCFSFRAAMKVRNMCHCGGAVAVHNVTAGSLSLTDDFSVQCDYFKAAELIYKYAAEEAAKNPGKAQCILSEAKEVIVRTVYDNSQRLCRIYPDRKNEITNRAKMFFENFVF